MAPHKIYGVCMARGLHCIRTAGNNLGRADASPRGRSLPPGLLPVRRVYFSRTARTSTRLGVTFVGSRRNPANFRLASSSAMLLALPP